MPCVVPVNFTGLSEKSSNRQGGLPFPNVMHEIRNRVKINLVYRQNLSFHEKRNSMSITWGKIN